MRPSAVVSAFLPTLTLVLAALAIPSRDASAQFLPKNDLYLWDTSQLTFQMSEAEFNQIIDLVVGTYQPTIDHQGAHLTVQRDWENATVNASAGQDEAEWRLYFFGGLARRPEITPDGFTLVVCHELGHHLGGFPFKADENLGSWAATEGQADYFAVQECLKKIWRHSPTQNAESAKTVRPAAKQACDQHGETEAARNLCYRITQAGESAMATLAVAHARRGDPSPPPSFDTPDTSKVIATLVGHPRPQCRLDTYLEGAICQAKFNLESVPGRHHPSGQSSLDAEKEASDSACTQASGFKDGHRPACWFHARL